MHMHAHTHKAVLSLADTHTHIQSRSDVHYAPNPKMLMFGNAYYTLRFSFQFQTIIMLFLVWCIALSLSVSPYSHKANNWARYFPLFFRRIPSIQFTSITFDSKQEINREIAQLRGMRIVEGDQCCTSSHQPASTFKTLRWLCQFSYCSNQMEVVHIEERNESHPFAVVVQTLNNSY